LELIRKEAAMSSQVVIADDDRDMRRGLELRARKWGYDVIPVEDGEAACELLIPADGPNLAILDRHMPAVDGVDVCKRVRDARPHSDVFMMMLTGRNSPRDVASALDSGANDYVSKPYDDTVLKARLDAGTRGIRAVAESTQLIKAPPPENPQTVLKRVLQADHLVPEFDSLSMTYDFGSLNPSVERWAGDGGIQPVVMDRVKLCPQCEGLPTFRDGCTACGSARIRNERLIHHFRCGHVASQSEFEQRDALACPKCLGREMVVGVDFEHLNGPHQCSDCDWTGMELESIGQCIKCGLRFPGHQATVKDLVGYHVQRMDLLADFSAPA
jgi:DNA-binding response OmpR family regulator